MSKWIKCSDRLPPFDVYVLGYYCGGNWHSIDDPNRVVVMRQDSADSDPGDPNNGNAGYVWKQFGPMRFFGRDISYWQHLPSAPVTA